ncbi:MAG: AraC family transcriptional regulator ligand-binding domain-containing protein [Pseudomonadota bacterium]
MDSLHGAIRAVLLINLVKQVRDLCVNETDRSKIAAILSEIGITDADLSDEISFVSLRKLMALLTRCSVYFNDPWFGLRMAQALPMGGTGLIGLFVFNAPTAHEGIHQLAASAPTFMRPVDAGFREAGGVGTLQWSFASTGARLGDDFQFSLFIAAIVALRFRTQAGAELKPLKVVFERSPIPVSEAVTDCLGPRIEFDGDENSLSFSLTALARPLDGADPTLYAVLKELTRRWLSEARLDIDIVARTRSEIILRMNTGLVDLERTAQAMQMSPRLLQYRLEQVVTNFEKLLNETRSEVALRLLRDTDRPVSEIAYDLGYSDPSVLTRAVRRWFDQSPRELRMAGRRASALGQTEGTME